MIDVAIVGAGEVGGSLAHVLAKREFVRRIQLVDPSGQIAAGKALDIMQSAPIEGFATPVAGSTDISRVAGAGLVFVADMAKPDQSGDQLLVLKQLRQLAPRAVLVCAGADGLSLVERGIRELGIRRTALVGSAPEALVGALRALVALQSNRSVRDVSLVAIGVPPANMVVSWEDVMVAGQPATSVLGGPTLRKLSAQIGPLWPPGPHALGHAAAETAAAVCGVSRRTVVCFVAPDDSFGQRTRSVALPVRLGLAGVTAIEPPPLSGNARTALENAMLL
jgi:malate dehydrogenase